MKRIFAALLAALLLVPALALAAGNATIAVRGRDGFDDYITSMFVWEDKLLLTAHDAIYAWDPETGLEKLEGYDELGKALAPQEDEDGERYAQIGGERFDLDEGESFYLSGSIYAAAGKLYRMAVLNGEDGPVGVLLLELRVEDGGFSFGEVIDLGDALIEDYGGYSSVNDLGQNCEMDGVLYGIAWTMNGRAIVAVDLETGDVDEMGIDTEDEITGVSAFGDGKLLLSAYSYGENGEYPTARFLLYDVEAEELAEIGELSPESYNLPAGLCYDEARARLYYVMDGCVWRVSVGEEGLGEPEAFGDMPIDIYSDAAPVMLGDLYVLSSYDGVLGRDVTAEKMPEQHLTIDDTSYADPVHRAYFDFAAVHPEFAVSIVTGSNRGNELLEAMMTQSANADIFVVDASDSAYAAMRDRGYMAELGGSEKLRAFVDGVYPSIAAACSAEGELYAVPFGFYASAYGINLKLLEKLGFTEEDVPTTWPEFFDLLAKISDGRMEDFPEASLLEMGYTQRNAQSEFLSGAIQSYTLWLDADEAHLERADETLEALLEAYERIDWTRLNMPEEYEEEEMFEYASENVLLEMYNAAPDQLEYMNRDYETRLLSLAIADGEEPMLGAELTVAFVNPFSEQRESAIEYLEMAASLIEQPARIALCPEENEPVENDYYQEGLKNYDEAVAEIEKSVAEAEEKEDDETLAVLKENLEYMQEAREEYVEHGRWNVSPETIALYREVAAHLTPIGTNLWEGDEESTYSKLVQYMDGAINAEQLSMELEKTLEMKRLEDM